VSAEHEKTRTQEDSPPEEKVPDAAKERGGVQSIERAFAIAEEVARNREGIGLAELSKRVGLAQQHDVSPGQDHGAAGYVSQLADSRKYRIGRRMFTARGGCAGRESNSSVLPRPYWRS